MAPLPPAWLAIEDSESGDIYFYHERTGRVTWEHPVDKHYRKLAKAALVEKYGGGGVHALHSGSSSEGTDSDSDAEHVEAGHPVTPERPNRRPSLQASRVPAPPPRPQGGPRPAAAPNRMVTMSGTGAGVAPRPFRRPGVVHVIGATGAAARTGGMALSPRDRRSSGGDGAGELRGVSPVSSGREPAPNPGQLHPGDPGVTDVGEGEMLLLPPSRGDLDNGKLEEV
jgi:hypothetical protein